MKSREQHLDSEQSLNMAHLDEIIYWSKKWEISPKQLLLAVRTTHSNKITKIREYLVKQGFAV